MKLDTKALRYLNNEDWRVLTAVETGSRNHEVVPTPLIVSLSGLRSPGGVHKSISNLAKASLIAKVQNSTYDGYRLTYGGLDYLALHAHLKSNTFTSLGSQIGTGKESDIYVVASSSSSSPSTLKKYVLKIHRLGRISFRTVKANRDYLRHRKSASWMYMSRLAALKEFTYMRALYDAGFPVPEPIAHNRHTVIMELVDGWPLRQVKEVGDPAGLYADCMELVVRLAGRGLIHGDFNEFNILIKEEEEEKEEASQQPNSTSPLQANPEQSPPPPPPRPTPLRLHPILIDFPQLLSTSHPNAAAYFTRDVDCLKRFFTRRFHFTSLDPGPSFEDAVKVLKPTKKKAGGGKKEKEEVEGEGEGEDGGMRRLDVKVEASGFSRKMGRELEGYMEKVGVGREGDGDGGESGSDEDEDGESEDEDGRDEEEHTGNGKEAKAEAETDTDALADRLAGATAT